MSDALQHTGVTDLPLTPRGEVEAVKLGEQLEGLAFAEVLTSPLQRAVRSCELAGLGSAAQVEPDLRLWNETPHGGRINPAQVRGHGEEARR